MSDDNHHNHDIRDWDGQPWHFVDGRPYRKAKTLAEFTAELAEERAAQVIPDPVAAVKRVKRIE